MLIIVSYALIEKYHKAKEQVNIFCNTFDLKCNQYKMTSSLIIMDNSRYLISSLLQINLTNVSDILFSVPKKEISFGDMTVFLRKPEKTDSGSSYISFIVGHDSELPEFYFNSIYYELREKYGYKASNSNDVNWPPFMPEDEARKNANSIAAKLKLPFDMVLQSLIKNEKTGIWTAIWWRKHNGYYYENDRVLISMMGVTGEFIEYAKIYEGTPCPTVVKITENEALKMGWKRLIKALPENLQSQAHEFYRAHASLRIVQPNMFGRLPANIKKKQSRLAWIIYFNFTGGIDIPSMEDRNAFDKARGEQREKWVMLGQPPREYEVRYDADNGSILESSYPGPAWTWKFLTGSL
jgi:hypothetical protein